MTRSRRRETIRAERDLESADFIDRYADAVESGLPFGPNNLRHPDEVRAPLLAALRGLASSFRAGIVD
jgi:hypothetical protein